MKVVPSGYQSCHYPCHSVRPEWQAGLMIGELIFRKPFEVADSQYQLCPHYELPNFQNLAFVGVQCLLSLVLNFFIRENSFLIENCD